MRELSKEELKNLYQEIIKEEQGITVVNEGTLYQGWIGKFANVEMKKVKELIRIYLKENNIKATVSQPFYQEILIKVKSDIENNEVKELIKFTRLFNRDCTNTMIDYFDRRFYLEIEKTNGDVIASD